MHRVLKNLGYEKDFEISRDGKIQVKAPGIGFWGGSGQEDQLMSYTIVGTAIGSSSEVDADMCRVSGYITDIHGDSLVSQEIKVRNIARPLAIGSSTIVLQELQQIRSDSDGYVEFDLYQGATVRVEIPGRETDLIRTMLVPEEDTVDLVAWLSLHHRDQLRRRSYLQRRGG